MKHTIIGTAGHVDHGKTLLIKALTGIDTDRLKEEKKRGITIELGFAYLSLPDGERAGIIDVPGHEKFVKNMLAGAGGIDIALLIVAADDGVMPQTREHLGILSLLDIKDGIIVVTKSDLVDQDWLEMVTEDIKKEVKNTFLQNAPVMCVSAYTGQGIEELRELLCEKVQEVGQKSTVKPFRVPVDRVFSVDGFGTVITGTLIEGQLNEGDEVEIYPTGLQTRVRGLQVHSKDVDTAYAGQRVAVNLAGVKKEEVERGNTLGVPGSMQNTMMLDVKLSILRDSQRVIANGSRLHFYHGSHETLCKVVLLEQDELAPGQEGFAQLRFTDEIAAKKGDRFVVRFYSPIETVGGGVVLDPTPIKHRRKIKKVIDSLRIREQGSAEDNLLQAIADGSPRFTPLADIQKQLLLDDSAFRDGLGKLEESGGIVRLSNKVAISGDYMVNLEENAKKILEEYHEANPLQVGMRRDELRSRLLPGRDMTLVDKVLGILADRGVIRLDNQKAALSGFQVSYTGSHKKLADEIEALFREGAYAPPSLEDIYAKYPKERNDVKQVIEAMQSGGALVSVAPGIHFHGEMVSGARESITAFITENGEITLPQFRDLSGTSRKFALALLEYFDRHGVTKKVGDGRVIAKK